MKKKKILSIIIIVFGISLILSGLVFSLNNKEISTSEKSNESNKKDDKIIPTNDEKNAISWIGHYKDQNGNEIGVVVKNFSNYEIFFLNQEEFILGIDSITQDELKKESDTLDIELKKENDVIKATIDLKIDGINMNLEPETEYGFQVLINNGYGYSYSEWKSFITKADETAPEKEQSHSKKSQ